jgi:sterol desaturase/sphingolipid hydroxylase (fatty acid hydroxylase superfamily)
LEHSFVILYQNFHIQHHRYKVPKLFDAFSGSLGDTIIMILIPLWITSRIVHTNLWSYIAFGAIYSSWLLIIHCEYDFPWDGPCRKFGFGTPREHRAHHKYLKYNYGHLFMFWDYLFGTMHKISKN